MRRPWLVLSALIAACDPPSEPTVIGVAARDMPDLQRIGEVAGPHSTAVRYAQVIDGLPVYHRELRTLVRDDGTVVASTGNVFSKRTRRAAPRFVDDEQGAIRRAVQHSVGLRAVRVDRARARQVWWPIERGDGVDELVAAWVVEAYTSDPASTSGDLRRTVIADDGRLLSDESLVDDAFSYRVFAETGGAKHPFDGPTADATPHPTGIPDGSYPAYIAPELVTVESTSATGDPWLPPDATQTVGNNVDAYVDTTAPNGLTDGDFRATASGASFDRVYDTSVGPLVSQDQQMASVTSLFYITNWLHDLWYDVGFTEAAGNAQAVNFGRGGVEGDPLLAEAQDNALGGSRNNANMATPDDGMSPRLQVYLWGGRDTRTMTMQPSGRSPEIGGALYGPKNFNISGTLVFGQDTGMSAADGCSALTNAVSGKLVLVDRGNCTFKTKTFNVQNAGGIGVVIIDNVSASSPPVIGNDSTIMAEPVIPSVSVTQAEGAAIASDLSAGTVTATIQRVVAPELDGALDSTLVAHEFGHLLHHRLAFCGNFMCRALSEGWGDFSALMMLARPGDNLRGAFPFSVYVTRGYPGDPGYFGIRRAPYSVDPNINALSFRHMADSVPLPTNHPIRPSNNNSEIHNAGEVWAEALWDGYVSLQEQDGGTSAGGAAFEANRAKMARYVVTGLAMTPVEATPMQARDALLAAAIAESPRDHSALVEAFARHGFGSCAKPPPQTSADFVGLVESTVIAGKAELGNMSLADACDRDGVLDSGETAHVQARVINRGHASLHDITFTLKSQLAGVTVTTAPVHLDQLGAFGITDLGFDVALAPGIHEALAGDLAIEVEASNACEPVVELPIATRLNVDDVETASATDTFDTLSSIWSPWTIAWSHDRVTPLNGIWHGMDLPISSDVSLTSPFLVASKSEPVVITFSHKFSFELNGGDAWDGGVVEYSIDNGVTWTDVTSITQAGYTGEVSTDSDGPLAGQLAYVGANPSWPDMDTVKLDLGMVLAGTTFQVRFRIGTDGGTGAYGWDVDEVAFEGIVGKPFPAALPDDGNCLPPPGAEDPIISGGGGCCDGGRPSNLLLALLLLPLFRPRRRA